MSSLTEFPLFTQLPLDVRFLIWQLLIPLDRVVLLEERVSCPTTDFTDTIYQNDSIEIQENRHLATELSFVPISLQTYRGQTQLEHFDFISSQPAPSLPTDGQIREDAKRQWEQLRRGKFYTPDPIPILLHICQESRSLAQAYGYALAFSTRTAPAMTWFNYRKDILYIHPFFLESSPSVYRDYSYPDRPGSESLSQLQVTDLEKVERLAVMMDDQYYYGGREGRYAYGQALPPYLQDVGRSFSGLKELFVVMADNYEYDPHLQFPKKDESYTYWPYAEGGKADRVVLDMEVEEHWGHCVGWEPESNPHFHRPLIWYEDENTPRTVENLALAAEEISKHFPSHPPQPPPKSRIVTVLPRSGAEKAPESRLRFRQYIHKLFHDRVEEEKTGQKIAFRFQLLQEDYQEDPPSYNPVSLNWITNAVNALSLTGEEPLLFTEQWMDNHLKQKELNHRYQESYIPRYWQY